MIGKMLQDWTTIRGPTGSATIAQSASEWLDVAQFQDVTFWLVLRDFNSGGASALTLAYQTAPLEDERLFVSLVTPIALSGVSLTTPKVSSVLSATFTSSSSIALGAWLRWSLSAVGASSSWDVTFRIDVTLNRMMTFPPRDGIALRVGDARGGR